MNKIKRVKILQRLLENNQHPITELNFNSTFELLIAVLLSAQATDVSVNKAIAKLYLVANTPESILELGVDGLKSYIKSIGIFNRKAEYVIKTCRIILEKHEGKVPKDRTSLEMLPGVGRKTANIVLNTAFNLPTIAVDTHVFRVCNRTNFASGNTVKQVEQKLLKIVPLKFKFYCHNLLMMHGRYTCSAKKMNCSSCIIKKLCEYYKK